MSISINLTLAGAALTIEGIHTCHYRVDKRVFYFVRLGMEGCVGVLVCKYTCLFIVKLYLVTWEWDEGISRDFSY